MIHDFGVTQSRVVFMDLPVVFDIDLVAQGLKMPFRWDDSHQARVGVMPRNGAATDMIWCDIEPCYVFHPLNAYDFHNSPGVYLIFILKKYITIYKMVYTKGKLYGFIYNI
jgi:carotenoid cleavage dioxygenase-like enzyme